LVLGLRVGEEAYVNDHAFVLVRVFSARRVVVRDAKSGESHDIVVGQSKEVLPDVFFALGDRSTRVMARLSIDAPRNMKILHGTKYWQLRDGNGEIRPPPATAEDKKVFKVPPDILAKARELGIFGNTAEMRVKQMARLSAPISMLGYNRRFQQYVIFVDQTDTIIAVDRMTDDERAYYDSRHYEDRRLDDQVGGEAEVERTRTRSAPR
jgi:hypothetical protein